MTRLRPGVLQAAAMTLSAVLGAPSAFAAGSATASFDPAAYTPGVPVSVTIEVSPDLGTAAYAVEDAPPVSWTIDDISSGGAFDAANERVKWGPFLDDGPRTLSYEATPPAGAVGTATFSGTASFDGAGVAIGGARMLPRAGTPPNGGSATRELDSSSYAPGVAVSVSIAVSPASGIAAYAVEDLPPDGWSVSDVSDGGAFDTVNRRVKWGPFLDDAPRALAYRTTPPAGTSGTATFSGTASFEGAGVVIGGDSSLVEGGPPPDPPAGPWLSATSLPGFEVKARISPGAEPPFAAALVPSCIPETLCLSGALPGRSELFVRVIGPRPNGYFWPNLVKFSTSELEVWIRQVKTGQIQYYRLPRVEQGERLIDLSGLADKEGFLP